MNLKSVTYKQWLILAGIAIVGWLVGYFVRWNKSAKRPYIRQYGTVENGNNGSARCPIVDGLVD